jgi:hypothetical protein
MAESPRRPARPRAPRARTTPDAGILGGGVREEDLPDVARPPAPEELPAPEEVTSPWSEAYIRARTITGTAAREAWEAAWRRAHGGGPPR